MAKRSANPVTVGQITQLGTGAATDRVVVAGPVRMAPTALVREMESDASRSAPGEDALEQLSVLADRAHELQGLVEAKRAELDELAAELASIERDRVPALMDAAGVSSFRTRSGLSVDVQDVASATLGCGRDEAEVDHAGRVRRAFEWLRSHGHGGIVKRTLTVALGRGADEVATKLVELIRAQGLGVDVVDREEVHPSTLGAFVREELTKPGAGAFPQDLFRVSLARVAKIKRDRPRR